MNSGLINRAVLSMPGEGEAFRMVTVRLSSAQTGGALEVFENTGKGFPLPHVHRDHDECFYVIEGVFTFTVGTEELEAPAGSLVFVPRGMRHAFKYSEGAKALFFLTPAGLEGFFRELSDGLAAGRADADLRAALAGKYDSWPVG